jgi:hypothetical protein
MRIEILQTPISPGELHVLAGENYGDMIKGVVDLERKVIALGGELHADAEALLLHDGSLQEHLWGFNVYPERSAAERIEYTSFINIRPRHGNRAMEVQDPGLRARIHALIDELIPRQERS